MKRLLLLLLACVPLCGWAQSWDVIQESGEYYFGVGRGKTVDEAKNFAVSELVGQIATHVSSDFQQLDDQTTTNGAIDHKSRVLNCVKTYSQATLTNVQTWVLGKEPDVTVRAYMKRSELNRIYENRIVRAKDMVQQAEQLLERRKVDMALQYYYWGYSLIRSLQYPNEAKGDDGTTLVETLPIRIADILGGIRVEFEEQEDENVLLRFFYDDQPVSSLGFTYNDGRSNDCDGSAKDGRGMIELSPGYSKDVYHLHIKYEYKEQARGDAELESVLNVITKKVFPAAGINVKGKAIAAAQKPAATATPGKQTAAATKPAATKTAEADKVLGMNLQPDAQQTVAQADEYADIMAKVVEAARTRNLSSVDRYFTVDGGLPRYHELLKTGRARVVGTPNIVFFKSMEGRVVARGLQMSLTYMSRGRKQTFVEDVVFTFSPEKKIENVTFGLGQVAANDILCKHPQWSDETREQLMEFLENYKTAYCMKDLAYIREIFADDAVIIIGNVVKRAPSNNREHAISVGGQQTIRYNRYTKDEYLKNLERCFLRNEFINLRFSNNEIQRLNKFQDKELFGIQIGQEYSSSTYGDKGYLFLLVDLTDHDLPQIKIRTWQPNEESMEKLYHAGDFYDN